MTYRALDDERHEIRVLQFDEAWSSDLPQRHLRISMSTVSLDDRSENFELQRPDQYSLAIESRSVSLDGINPPTAQPSSQPVTRFTWGDYQSLSYAWGDQTEESYILLNNALKQVSCNLEAALRTLHRLPETACGMKYWIDALCINQDDVSERNHQVKRMQDIYKLARSVVVWLGPEAGYDDKAIQAMRKAGKNEENRVGLQTDQDEGNRRALNEFMNKPYWTRLWVVQELAANHDNTLFLTGSKILTRTMIKLGSDTIQALLKHGPRLYLPQEERSNAWSIANRVYSLLDLDMKECTKELSGSVLNLSRNSLATDPRDKVYGIRGLLPDSISRNITPDYKNTSEDEVFATLAISIIEETGNLDNIIYGSISSKGMPSWVLDLRLPFPRNHVAFIRHSVGPRKRTAHYAVLERVNAGFQVLRLRGIQIGVVDGLTASPKLDGDKPVYPTNAHVLYEDISYAIERTLTLGCNKMEDLPDLKDLPWDLKRNGQRH